MALKTDVKGQSVRSNVKLVFGIGFLICLGVIGILLLSRGTDGRSDNQQKESVSKGRAIPDAAKGKKKSVRPPNAEGSKPARIGLGYLGASKDVSSMPNSKLDKQVRDKSDLSDLDIQPETLRRLQVLFDKLERNPDAESAFMHELSGYKRSAVLAAARATMRYGSSGQKISALLAVANLFSAEGRSGRMVGGAAESAGTSSPGEGVSTDGKTINKAVDEGVAESMNASGDPLTEAQEDRQSQEIVGVVSSGLTDANSDVKSMAFSAMRSLPFEESGVLASQILTGDDTAMKVDLMKDLAQSSNPADIRMSVMGMGNPDQEVRSLAAANLKAVSGQDFASEEQAAEWLDQNLQPEVARSQQQTQKESN